MDPTDNPHDILIKKLETRCWLADRERRAIRAVAFEQRRFPPQTYLARTGGRPPRCTYIMEGFACRHKLTVDGARGIIAILLPGDFCDVQQLFLLDSDHNVQTLTAVTAVSVAMDDLRALILEHPGIGRAIWIDALIEASITREAVLNVARRDGLKRLAHLLCEVQMRSIAAGLSSAELDLPMTQEELGDALGLTSVHVNRMLKQLQTEGLIAKSANRRQITISNWVKLQERADFNPAYLHLDQAKQPPL